MSTLVTRLRITARRPLYPDAVPIDFEAEGLKLHWDEKDGLSGDLVYWVAKAIDDKREVLITPTGPTVPVKADDPRSVIALLKDDFAEVTWEGELPDWPYPEDAPTDAVF